MAKRERPMHSLLDQWWNECAGKTRESHDACKWGNQQILNKWHKALGDTPYKCNTTHCRLGFSEKYGSMPLLRLFSCLSKAFQKFRRKHYMFWNWLLDTQPYVYQCKYTHQAHSDADVWHHIALFHVYIFSPHKVLQSLDNYWRFSQCQKVVTCHTPDGPTRLITQFSNFLASRLKLNTNEGN